MELYTSTGLLHISGSGNMKNFVGKTDERPWQGFKNQISKVVIDEGITGIGGDSFIQGSNLSEIEIPSSVKSIGQGAFYGTKIKEIMIPDSVETVGALPFFHDYALEYVYCSEDNQQICEDLITHSDYADFHPNISASLFIQKADGSIDFFDSKKDPVMKKDKDGNIIELCATNPDKSISCFNDKQKLTRKLHAKIYTVEEAMAVTREGNVNRVRLTYK